MLRCTGRCVLPCSCTALALAVRAGAHLALPGPGLPRFRSTTWTSRGSSRPAHGFNVDFVWIFPEVGGAIPARSRSCRSPPTPTGCRWRPSSRCPFLAVLGADSWASALPFALIGAIAAPLTWAIARDAGRERLVAVGAGILMAVPAAVRRST